MEATSHRHRLDLSEVSWIKGMESVVATVSGYHGSERFNLIKLISNSGANYVGSMSRSVTHLVCHKFEGAKYDLAKKLKTIVVNHRWVEDCIKQRKRLPERPYMLRSGQEVGPLLVEAPCNAKKEKVVSENRIIVVDDSEGETDKVSGGLGRTGWTDSMLFDENSSLKLGKSCGNSHKPKPKLSRRRSKVDRRSDAPVLVTVEYEDSSSDSNSYHSRSKRKISKFNKSDVATPTQFVKGGKTSIPVSSTSVAIPSSRRRRLVKKNVGDDFGSARLGFNQDVERIFNTGETFDEEVRQYGEIKEDFIELVEPEERDIPPLQERISGNGCSNSENINGEIKDTDRNEQVTRPPLSTDLSCVICWTKSSSKRGVLSCGHRFCYSCIHDWADHKASLRHIPTCPLCKASFMSITMLEDAGTSDQKIYSQTIPCGPSTTDIFMFNDLDRPSVSAEPSLFPTCSHCRSQEPVELLERCHICRIRCIHRYCLDPPLFPWTCIDCKDLRRHYRRNL